MAAKIHSFRKMLKRSLLLEDGSKENQLFDQIPDAIIESIFEHNFNGSLATAERILMNRYSEVEDTDLKKLEQEKRGIQNLAKAADRIRHSLDNNIPVLFVTDNDNDGSLAQAILMEFVEALPDTKKRLVHIEYAQPIGASRGLTKEVTDLAVNGRKWDKDQAFTLVTADNGINNQAEVARIEADYPNAFVIITDHHLPNKDVVVENERTLVFDPKYNPTPYFAGHKNISGANTLGVLLTQVLPPSEQLTTEVKRYVDNMQQIGIWANLLDYASADIADMPNRPYVIEKALQLRPLLNVSNSMNTLVLGRYTEADLASIATVSEGKLTPEWVHDRVNDVKLLNDLARKLLTLYHRYNNRTGDSLRENDFYAALSAQLENPDEGYTSINPNYIEQLRPIVFNLAATGAKNMFLAKIEETMTELFDTLRDQERTIQEGLRQVGLLRQDRRPNSSILFPVNEAITKVFNRKLLGKAYNQDNNGFHLILSTVHEKEASGSMRSLYSVVDILEGKEKIEKKLGITLDFQGHEHAAGFFVRAAGNTKITEGLLSQLNVWLDGRVQDLKAAEKINMLPNVELDFASVGLITKVNQAVKANLAGMYGIPGIITFSPDKENQVWVTDPKTTEQISLAEIVKRKRYGYQAIATDFGGGAFVVPVELLRTIVESRYKKALRLSYMDEGVFMGSQVVDPEQMPTLAPVKGGRDDQDDLIAYYDQHFAKDHFMPLAREDFRNIPYFKYNRYGEQEFEQWEALVLAMLDHSGRDVLSVVDTEGTGLGKAPKCFNLGGTNIKVAEGSGERMSYDAFEKHLFRGVDGREYLLTPKQLASLMDVHEDEQDNEFDPAQVTVLYSTTVENGFESTRWIFPGVAKDLQLVRNRKVEEREETVTKGRSKEKETRLVQEVVYNRTIDGFAFVYLIANNDFAITPEFEDLTGVSNHMAKSRGMAAKNVDEDLTKRLSAMKNADGEDAKFIFQAHNMPYDKGVVSANFQRLNKMMDEHVTSDTAKIARREKLAYDDTPVCSFEGVDGIPAKAYFYDSPFSDYSMTTFLERVAKHNKGGVFPDINTKILLRYDPSTERFSVIDRVANQEVLLNATVDQLMTPVTKDAVTKPARGKKKAVEQEDDELPAFAVASGAKVVGSLPNNAVKYSVERMSARAMIRNILLFDKGQVELVDLKPEEADFSSALELFQKNYHFDNTPEENIAYFLNSLSANQGANELRGQVKMTDLAERFLLKNRHIQAKFHDAWIYEKVLGHYEPSASRINLTQAEVEQINYFTDLPSKKIREVCRNVVEFKRHFGIEHALVHEQHNNIRMRSADGQGLADTVYECVLPQHMGLQKFYNPYYRSVEPAAIQLIEQNFKGSMTQHMVNDNFKSEIARDSYSMKQMMAFRRQGNTDVINRARRLAAGTTGEALEPIKFKLAADVLPPGTAIYATPRRHITQEEVYEVSKLLDEILVNEQVKTSAAASNLDQNHAIRSVALAQAHDDDAIQKRDRIMEMFSEVVFSKRDGEVTKMADLMKDAVETGSEPKLPKGFRVSGELLEIAEGMIQGLEEIYAKINQGEKDTEHLRSFFKSLKKAAEDTAKRDEEEARSETLHQKAAEKHRHEVDVLGIKDENTVRTATFLPDLDIARREPFKFMIKHTGLANCLPLLREQAAQRALEDSVREPVVEAEVAVDAPKPRRRRRAS